MKIAISQRVEHFSDTNEVRDCLDQSWVPLLEGLGITVLPVPNALKDVQAWLTANSVEGALLSGGNDLSSLITASNPSKLRDTLENEIISWCSKRRLPILGVCRGMQLLNDYFGGCLTEIDGHVATVHYVEKKFDCPEFPAYAKVNSFHRWAILNDGLAQEFREVYMAGRTVEAMKHVSLPIYGIMWHPERENAGAGENDLNLIKFIFSSRSGDEK